MGSNVRGIASAIGVGLSLLALCASVAGQAAQRANVVSAAALDSTDAVRRTVAAAAAANASVLVVAVPLYSTFDGSFDGITAVIHAAHDRGLKVRASIATNVVTDGNEFPSARDHVLYQHPEWLMVPRTIAPEMLRTDVRSPGYIGRLSRWTRANASRVAGIYLSPLSPAAAEYAARALEELVRRYPFDALDIRTAPYPDEEFDYSRQAMELFKGEVRARLTTADRTRMDEVESIDPFAYADEFPDEWQLFRRARLDDLVARLSASARTARPSILLAAGDTGPAADTR
jgi:uncharacterized lipoprotein YddW (UPF0748 family)